MVENKKVSIMKNINVCLIPKKEEYNICNSLLWWSDKDIEEFKLNFELSLKVISKMNNVNYIEAKKIMSKNDSILKT